MNAFSALTLFSLLASVASETAATLGILSTSVFRRLPESA